MSTQTFTQQYITPQRCLEAFPAAAASQVDAQTLQDCLNGACAFIDRYCNRAVGGFAIQTYDELMHGTGERIMFLNEVPIVNITKLATNPLPAIYIRNDDSDIATQAFFQVIGVWNGNYSVSTGINLTLIKNGITSTNTFLWTDPGLVIVDDLVTAINGIGSGWQAGPMSGLNTWPLVDFRATQGNLGCRVVTAYVFVHWMSLPVFRINEKTGEVQSEQGFCRGSFNWRAVYTAGYDPIPDDLQQAIAELTYATYTARTVNPNLNSFTLDKLSYTAVAEKSFDGLSVLSKTTIYGYRRHPVYKFSTW
jgi:hypothetical protein